MKRFQDGPCYDYCSCSECWNGWTDIPVWKRSLWRAEYVFDAEGKRLHVKLRRNKTAADGRTSFGLGARAGTWPCLGAVYLQVQLAFWNLSVWFGRPSYKGGEL